MQMNPEHTSEKQDTTQRYEVLMELGDCNASVGRYEQARQYYERAADLEPDAAGPYVGLGVVALQSDMTEDADAAFRVALRLDPGQSRAYAGLAMIRQKTGEYTAAFEMYLKCLERNTDNLTALLGLFQVSCQMGSFEKIIHYLRVYLNQHPGDVSVMFSLGALYMKDANYTGAKDILLNVLALDPDNKEAANLLEEAEHGLARTGSGAIAV